MLTTAAIDANADATGADNTTFKKTDGKLYVPIVTLSVEDNSTLSKLLSKGFKRFIYWNKYKVIDNIVVSFNNIKEEKYIKNCLFLLMIIQQVIIKFLLIFSKYIFFQELK